MATTQLRLWLGILLIGFSDIFVNPQMQTFKCSDITYIRPDQNEKSWSEAQNVCRNFSATLPIADNPDHQSCFVSALRNFSANRAYSWMGANSSGGDPKVWRWLDGSPYQGQTVTPGESYQQGYAYATRNNGSGIQFYAARPTDTHPYICRYSNSDRTICINGSNRVAYIKDGFCFVKYNESLSWFSARNNCLSNNGDLAYFSDTSVLNNIVNDTGMWWIGLRSIWWNWIDAASGEKKDVAFIQWKNGQPDGDSPQCMSTVEADTNLQEYFSWRDYDCNAWQIFICQLSTHFVLPLSTPPQQPPLNNPSSTSSISSLSSLSPSSTVFPTISSLSSSSSLEAGAWSNADASLSTVFAWNTGEIAEADNSIKRDNKVALGVGIGVGVGGLILIAIIVLIVLITWRRRRKSSKQERSGSKMTHHNVPDVIVTHPFSPENSQMAKSDGNEASHSKARHSNTSLQNTAVPAEETPRYSTTSFQDPTAPTVYAPVHSATTIENRPTVVPKEDTQRYSNTSFQNSAGPTDYAPVIPVYSAISIENRPTVVPKEDTQRYSNTSFQNSAGPTEYAPVYSATSIVNTVVPKENTQRYSNASFQDPAAPTDYAPVIPVYSAISIANTVVPKENTQRHSNTSFQNSVGPTDNVSDYSNAVIQSQAVQREDTTDYNDRPTSFQDPNPTADISRYSSTSFQDPIAPPADTAESNMSFEDPVVPTEYVPEYGDTSFHDPDAATEYANEYGDTQEPDAATEYVPEYDDTQDPVDATEYVPEYGDTQDQVDATEYVPEYGDTSLQDPVDATEYVPEYGDTSFQDPDVPTEDTPEYVDTEF